MAHRTDLEVAQSISSCVTAMGTPETHRPEPQTQQDPSVSAPPLQHQLFL